MLRMISPLNIAGEKLIQGKDEFAEVLHQKMNRKAVELHLKTIIRHGSSAAVEGILCVDNHISYAFC